MVDLISTPSIGQCARWERSENVPYFVSLSYMNAMIPDRSHRDVMKIIKGHGGS